VVFKAAGDITLDAGASITANGASGGTVTLDAAGTALVYRQELKPPGAKAAVKCSGTGKPGRADRQRIDRRSGATGGGTVLIGGDMHEAMPPCITPARLMWVRTSLSAPTQPSQATAVR